MKITDDILVACLFTIPLLLCQLVLFRFPVSVWNHLGGDSAPTPDGNTTERDRQFFRLARQLAEDVTCSRECLNCLIICHGLALGSIVGQVVLLSLLFKCNFLIFSAAENGASTGYGRGTFPTHAICLMSESTIINQIFDFCELPINYFNSVIFGCMR